jgi:hypothetical protein
VESLGAKPWDRLPRVGLFDTLTEANAVADRRRRQYSTARQHSSLGYQLPAPEVVAPWAPGFASALLVAQGRSRP